MFVPRGHMVEYAAAVKRAVNVPVIAVGRLDDPELAAKVVADGDADLVLLGRALIAEPDWPIKVEEGRFNELRPCIACNACVDLVGRGERARCSVNPEAGRELEWEVVPTAAAAPRDGRSARPGRAWRRRGSPASAATTSRSGSATSSSAASSRSPAWRRASARSCASATTSRSRLAELGVEIHLNVRGHARGRRRRGARRRRRGHRRRADRPADPGHRRRDRLRRPVAAARRRRGRRRRARRRDRRQRHRLRDRRAPRRRGRRRHDHRDAPGRRLRDRGDHPPPPHPRAQAQRREDAHERQGDHDRGRPRALRVPTARRGRSPADRVRSRSASGRAGHGLAEQISGPEVLVLGDASRPADFVSAINAGADAGLAV